MKVLIDGDILIYRCGFASENDEERFAVARLKRSIDTILQATNTTDYEIYLSDNSDYNFRNQIFPLYKANRAVQAKPRHYTALSNTLARDQFTHVASGSEADDELGIAATALGEDCIIASIDKDLLQIPGTHYNWVNDIWRTIGHAEGQFRFYKQILTGDTVDNITAAVGLSCPGVGAVKADAYLEGCESEEDYNQTIWEVFNRYCTDQTKDEIFRRIELTGQLVKIRQYKDEVWKYGYSRTGV